MRWLNTVGGLLVAACALVVLAVIGSTRVESAAEPAVAVPWSVMPAAVFGPPVTDSRSSLTPPDLPGVPPEVAATLGSSGYSTYATAAEVDRLLTPEVVATLESHGAVLVVPEPATTTIGR
ncbi:MAG: hypothetical protein R2823_04330 [Acidimicrobiia bacterium]